MATTNAITAGHNSTMRSVDMNVPLHSRLSLEHEENAVGDELERVEEISEIAGHVADLLKILQQLRVQARDAEKA
jgi:hypothetical protein